MCGIAGSSNFEKAYNLYKLNLPRGSYSSGLMAIDTKSGAYFIYKQQNAFENKEKDSLIWKIEQSKNNYNYFLFHSRAPTNTNKIEFDAKQNHPFEYDGIYAAHNGIITNYKQFEESKDVTVDSNLIPIHLSKRFNIVDVYTKYQGLLTSWIYKGNNNTIYIVKAGSTLFCDQDSFCSTAFEKAELIDDGSVMLLKDNKFELIEKFEYINPYYV